MPIEAAGLAKVDAAEPPRKEPSSVLLPYFHAAKI
jgi:hypothetical protein